MDIADIVDITVKTGRQNMAEYGRLPQIAVRLPSHGWSLVAESVETGGRV